MTPLHFLIDCHAKGVAVSGGKIFVKRKYLWRSNNIAV